MKRNKNYMCAKPQIKSGLAWDKDKNERVTLAIENKGIMKRLLRKPEVSYVHLDELGSFVWKQIDGKIDVKEIGKRIKVQFGEKSEPTYERLIKYFKILESYKFISLTT